MPTIQCHLVILIIRFFDFVFNDFGWLLPPPPPWPPPIDDGEPELPVLLPLLFKLPVEFDVLELPAFLRFRAWNNQKMMKHQAKSYKNKPFHFLFKQNNNETKKKALHKIVLFTIDVANFYPNLKLTINTRTQHKIIWMHDWFASQHRQHSTRKIVLNFGVDMQRMFDVLNSIFSIICRSLYTITLLYNVWKAE